MEKLFMSAGVVVAIVLCLIGILKLPFKSLKVNHCNWYKALFTIISFVLAISLSVLDEIYILHGEILSVDFAVLVSVVLAGVFSGYNGVYEGLGLKELVKKLCDNAKKAKELSGDKKIEKFVNKVTDIEKVIALLEERKNNQNVEV